MLHLSHLPEPPQLSFGFDNSADLSYPVQFIFSCAETPTTKLQSTNREVQFKAHVCVSTPSIPCTAFAAQTKTRHPNSNTVQVVDLSLMTHIWCGHTPTQCRSSPTSTKPLAESAPLPTTRPNINVPVRKSCRCSVCCAFVSSRHVPYRPMQHCAFSTHRRRRSTWM